MFYEGYEEYLTQSFEFFIDRGHVHQQISAHCVSAFDQVVPYNAIRNYQTKWNMELDDCLGLGKP